MAAAELHVEIRFPRWRMAILRAMAAIVGLMAQVWPSTTRWSFRLLLRGVDFVWRGGRVGGTPIRRWNRSRFG